MKIQVSHHLLHHILGPLDMVPDDEVEDVLQMDDQDPIVLRFLLNKYCIGNFFEYTKESQQRIKHSLGYYLGLNHPRLQRTLDSLQERCIDPPVQLFFSLLWDELFHEPIPKINPDDYEENNDVEFSNSPQKELPEGFVKSTKFSDELKEIEKQFVRIIP